MQWEHKRTGNRYIVLDRPKVRTEDGRWVEGVYYRSETDGQTYVRTKEEFESLFAPTCPLYSYA